ncbi:MAG: hypothetical protein GY943_16735 [Chloroflexi bacterium]|nr:hypothetical protein [Chloroflexota bacterium]
MSVDATRSARTLALENGVDLTAVEGSGVNGRVTRADVERHLENGVTPSEIAVEEDTPPVFDDVSETAVEDPATSPPPSAEYVYHNPDSIVVAQLSGAERAVLNGRVYLYGQTASTQYRHVITANQSAPGAWEIVS